MCSLMRRTETGMPGLYDDFDLDLLDTIDLTDSGRNVPSHFQDCTDIESMDEDKAKQENIFFPELYLPASGFDDLPFCRTGNTESEQPILTKKQISSPDSILLELLNDVTLTNTSKEGHLGTSVDSTSESLLPMYEQMKQHQPVLQNFDWPTYQLFDFIQNNPWELKNEDCGDEPQQAVSVHREEEIEAMADYVMLVIGSLRITQTDEVSSKLKVHEVILIVLLNHKYGDRTKDLRRILAFCDESGHELSDEARHFKTLDTETMGLLWMKIKGNKKGNYDTFARAMRVRREKSAGYFDYLDSGKRSKKKIYRFGEKAMAEMDRMRRTLRQVSAPQTCSSEYYK